MFLGPVPEVGYLMCLCQLIDNISWTSHHSLQWGLIVSKVINYLFCIFISKLVSYYSLPDNLILHPFQLFFFNDHIVTLLMSSCFYKSYSFYLECPLFSSFSLGKPFLILWNFFSSPSWFDYFSSVKIQYVQISFTTFIRTYCNSLFLFCLSWWTEFEWNLCLCHYICDTQHLWHWR